MIELNLEEKRKGEQYQAKLLLRRNDFDDRSRAIATCHTLADFLLIVPENQRDGTVRPAYGILLEKLGFLLDGIDKIRAMAEDGRMDGKHKHSAVGPYVAS